MLLGLRLRHIIRAAFSACPFTPFSDGDGPTTKAGPHHLLLYDEIREGAHSWHTSLADQVSAPPNARTLAHCKIPPPHRVGLGALPQHERASNGRLGERDRPACNRDERTARAENSDDCSKAPSRKLTLLSAAFTGTHARCSQRKLRRYLPDGSFEDWPVKELINE